MRTIDTLGDCKLFKFKGNMNATATALGDVDGDGDQELVVGNIDVLYLFQYLNPI